MYMYLTQDPNIQRADTSLQSATAWYLYTHHASETQFGACTHTPSFIEDRRELAREDVRMHHGIIKTHPPWLKC